MIYSSIDGSSTRSESMFSRRCAFIFASLSMLFVVILLLGASNNNNNSLTPPSSNKNDISNNDDTFPEDNDGVLVEQNDINTDEEEDSIDEKVDSEEEEESKQTKKIEDSDIIDEDIEEENVETEKETKQEEKNEKEGNEVQEKVDKNKKQEAAATEEQDWSTEEEKENQDAEEKAKKEKEEEEKIIVETEEENFAEKDFEEAQAHVEGRPIQKSTNEQVEEDEAALTTEEENAEDEAVAEEEEKEAIEDEEDQVEEEEGEAPKPNVDDECKSRFRLHPGIGSGPPVQYIHIPKAGGTSIQSAIGEWKRVTAGIRLFKYDGNSVGGSSSRCPSGAIQANFLMGHRGFGFCRDVSRRNLFTFTALRESVSRMVSLFDYNRYKLQKNRVSRVFGEAELSELIEKYNSTEEVEEGEALLRYSGSQQARFLCGYDCLGPNVYNKSHIFNENYLLEKAKENLYKLDAIGITDELSELIVQLRFLLPKVIEVGYKDFPSANKDVHKKSELAPKARKIMEQWGWVDNELFELAKAQYRKKQDIAVNCLKKMHGH